MVEENTSSPVDDEIGFEYEIKIKGYLEEHWADWMGGLSITHDGKGNSLLTGVVPDQAALHGILIQIRDLGLTLISITQKNNSGKKMNKTTQMLSEFNDAFQYAGFAKRLKAFAFDYIIIFSYILSLIAMTLAVSRISGFLGLSLRWPENPILADLIAFITLVLPVILYFTLQESSPKQSTWGKRKAGIRVVNVDGGRLTRGQAFVRSLVKMFPWQIAHTCLFHIPGWPFAVTTILPAITGGFILLYTLAGIYIAAALITKKHRTPYDWVSGSYVVVNQ